MNRTEIIKQLNELNIHSEAQKHCIKNTIAFIEELPDFTYKIDEERMKGIYQEHIKDQCVYAYEDSMLEQYVDIYNSTLSEGLKPLPKEMPEEFNETIRAWALNDIKELKEVWEWLINHYGTPEPKQPLPSVEELRNLIKEHLDNVKCNDDWLTITCKYIIDKFTLPTQKHSWQSVWELRDELLYMQDHGYTLIQIAQHLHDKYSLKPSEWWQDLKEGDKFINHDGIEVDYAGIGLLFVTQRSRGATNIKDATPYTITADEIIAKYNLSEEEVRVIREGK